MQELVMNIRPAALSDSENMSDIYNHFIANTTITFELDPVTTMTMSARISDVLKADLPWLVAELDGQLIGYAYATLWRARPAYRYSVETTIYLSPTFAGRGYGRSLYMQLLNMLQANGYHTAIGGIALPNAASIALHEKLGFAKVAHFSEVGYKFAQWLDVGYWQKRL